MTQPGSKPIALARLHDQVDTPEPLTTWLKGLSEANPVGSNAPSQEDSCGCPMQVFLAVKGFKQTTICWKVSGHYGRYWPEMEPPAWLRQFIRRIDQRASDLIREHGISVGVETWRWITPADCLDVLQEIEA